MAEAVEGYYGTICRLESEEDTTKIEFEPNAVMIGAMYELAQESRVSSRGKEYERVLVHDSDKRAVGFLPKDVARRVIRLFDEGWLCHVMPLLVAYSKKERAYWVEVAVVCYAPEQQEAFDAFLKTVGAKAASGERPDVRLSAKQVEQVVESLGAWSDVGKAKMPSMGKDAAVYKSKQTSTERLAMTAIEHTTGCYIVLAAATLAVAALVAHFLGVF